MRITNQLPSVPAPRPSERTRTGESEVEPPRRERRRRQRRRNRGGGRRATDRPEVVDDGAVEVASDAPHARTAAEIRAAQRLHLGTRRPVPRTPAWNDAPDDAV